MNLDDYIRVALKRWYVPALLLLLAVSGAYLYNYISATRTAEGEVAVPLAQFTAFDNVVNGQALPQRVAERLDDGTTAEQIDGMMAGGFSSGTRILPLYKIGATDADAKRATLVAQISLEESLKLFRETQAAQLDYITTSYEDERNKAEEEALAARDQFDRYMSDNNAFALPTRIAQQANLVSELRLQNGLSGDSVPADGTTAAGLAAAQDELDRLQGLLPEYNRLQLEVTLAEGDISSLEAQIDSLSLGGPGYDEAKAAVQEELDAATATLTDARAAVTAFEGANGVTDLESTLRSQQQTVNDLILLEATTNGQTLATDLASAEATLEHMQALEPAYNRLARELEQAERVVDIRTEQLNYVISSTKPTDTQVEIVTLPTLKSVFWWTAIRYAVAIFVAVFVSLLLLYVLMFFEKLPPTTEELEKALGAPVIARVPRTEP
jgi:capsular polysaccharide biosynthesis protein